MRATLLIFLIFFSACKSQHKSAATVDLEQVVIAKISDCPPNGNCTLELLPNKSIVFKQDDFGIGYPVISDGNKILLKYTFQKNPVPNTEDSNYTEIIYAELDDSLSEVNLKNEQLQQVKLYFGRLCFCKGETGFYPINKGSFALKIVEKNSIEISSQFKITEVPQIITQFNKTISLK